MAASIRAVRDPVVSSSLNGGSKPGGAGAPLLPLALLPEDGLHEVEAVVEGDAESLIVHRDAQGQVRAWFNICPHAGRRLDWAPGKFLRSKDGTLVCAAHGASFELQQGLCVAGPCRGESLREVAVDVRDDAVWLSTAG